MTLSNTNNTIIKPLDKIAIICDYCAAIINVDVQSLTDGKEKCPYCHHLLKAIEGSKPVGTS